MAEDRKSWEIKDAAILDDLVSLMGLSDEEKSRISKLTPQDLISSIDFGSAESATTITLFS